MQDELLEALPTDKRKLSGSIIHAVLMAYRTNKEAERSILLFRELRRKDADMRLATYEIMVGTCTDHNEPEEAVAILDAMKSKFGEKAIREDLWWTVLDSCTREYYVRHCDLSTTNDSYLEYYSVGKPYFIQMQSYPKDFVCRFYL